MGDRELGQGAFIVEEDFVFFDFNRVPIDVGELIEFRFSQGVLFQILLAIAGSLFLLLR